MPSYQECEAVLKLVADRWRITLIHLPLKAGPALPFAICAKTKLKHDWLISHVGGYDISCRITIATDFIHVNRVKNTILAKLLHNTELALERTPSLFLPENLGFDSFKLSMCMTFLTPCMYQWQYHKIRTSYIDPTFHVLI
jgi:hypothetical protein